MERKTSSLPNKSVNREKSKVLCIGTYLPEKIEHMLDDYSSAGNRFQLNLWKSLKKCGLDLVGCSFLGIPISEDVLSLVYEEKMVSFGKLLYVEKQGNALASTVRFSHKVRLELKGCDYVICYNVVYAWLFLPVLAKIKKKKSILVLADQSEESSYNNLAMRLYAKCQKKAIKSFDYVIGLSVRTKDLLKPSQSFLLMEGGIELPVYDFFKEKRDVDKEKTTFMYSGLLEKVTGVDLLLEAISLCKNIGYRFVFSGKGSLAENIMKASQNDSRIIWKGNMEYDDYLSCLKDADVLVNPRNMNLPENKNNFPSKIMDFLATGKPIISTRFEGWEKFDKYIHFIDTDVDAILQAFSDVAIFDSSSYDERRKFAKQFIWDIQAKRIVEQISPVKQ